MASISDAVQALSIDQYTLDGRPTSEAEFNSMFKKITGVNSDGTAILSSNTSDFGVTWSQVEAKLTELNAAEPLKRLREKRNILLSETDWWASSDLTMTTEQTSYRQALRDITDTYSSLDDVVWPTKP